MEGKTLLGVAGSLLQGAYTVRLRQKTIHNQGQKKGTGSYRRIEVGRKIKQADTVEEGKEQAKKQGRGENLQKAFHTGNPFR